MPRSQRFAFGKSEKLCSKIQIDRLFNGEGKSMSCFPLRLVYRLDDAQMPDVKVLVSVSKKHFRRAVKRNRVKRQIREAYRLNKQMLWDTLTGQAKALSLAFIWLSDEQTDSAKVTRAVVNLLQRLTEKLPLLLAEKRIPSVQNPREQLQEDHA